MKIIISLTVKIRWTFKTPLTKGIVPTAFIWITRSIIRTKIFIFRLKSTVDCNLPEITHLYHHCKKLPVFPRLEDWTLMRKGKNNKDCTKYKKYSKSGATVKSRSASKCIVSALIFKFFVIKIAIASGAVTSNLTASIKRRF